MLEVPAFRTWYKNSFNHGRCVGLHPQKQWMRPGGRKNLSKDPEVDRSLWIRFILLTLHLAWEERAMRRSSKQEVPFLSHWIKHLVFTGLREFISCNLKGHLYQATYGILYKGVSFQAELDLERLLLTVFIEYFNPHWNMGHHFSLSLLLWTSKPNYWSHQSHTEIMRGVWWQSWASFWVTEPVFSHCCMLTQRKQPPSLSWWSFGVHCGGTRRQ